MALWFNRGGGTNFVQGPGFAIGEKYAVYPQAFVDLPRNEATICYSVESWEAAGIGVARVHPLPDPARRYVFPRSNSPALFGETGLPPLLAAGGLLTFATDGEWVRSRRAAALGASFSLAVWVRPTCPPAQYCMLADTRPEGTRNGVLIGLLPVANSPDPGLRTPYFYPATNRPAHNLASPFNVPTGRWSYVGVSVSAVSATQLQVVFVVNGQASAALAIPAPPGGFGGEAVRLARFVGALRAVATFPRRALSLAEHNAHANTFAASLGIDPFLPSSANAPPADLQMDVSNATAWAEWASSAPPPADVMQVLPAGGESNGEALRFCGQASSGVDIDSLSGAPGEQLRASLRFRPSSTSSGAAVVLTVGDSRHTLRLAIQGGHAVVTTPNGSAPLGDVGGGGWHGVAISLEAHAGRATVTLDGGPPHSLDIGGSLAATWLYLGQGYRVGGISSTSSDACVDVDLASLHTNVTQAAPVAAPSIASPSSFSIGTDELRFVLNNASQVNWGCLDAVHVGGDAAATPRGVFADAPAGGATPLWQLTVSGCNESFPAGYVLQSCTAVCQRKYVAASTASTSATLRWDGCTTPFPGATLDIEVRVKVVGGVSTWGATVGKAAAAGLCLQSFTLPDLRTLRMTPGREEVFLPYMFGARGSCQGGFEGTNIMGPLLPEVEGGSGGGDDREAGWMPNGWYRTMSFTAWFAGPTGTEGGVGLYVGSHDPLSRLKMMPAQCLPFGQPFTHAALRAVHVPDSFNDASTRSFELPYDVVVAAISSADSWDAAQLYASWALPNARWSRKGKLSARPDVPPWVLDAPVWMKLGRADDPESPATLAKVDGVREALGGAASEMGVHWYGWNEEAFDSKYPVYSPRPGLRGAVAQLQKPHAGVTARVVPYTNGRIWDPSDGLTQLNTSTCRGRNQTAYHESYGSGVVFSVMDPAQPLMQQTWSDAVGSIADDLNVSGVYSDQISCSHAEACYDATNGTNASSWAAGSQALLASMAAKAGRGRVIISESQDQTMIADLHAFLSIYGWLGELKCTTTLAWQAVFGGWTVNVGDIRYPTVPKLRDGPTGKLRFNETEAAAWRAITAQGFVAGSVMGWFDAGGGWLNWLGLAVEDVGFVRLLASTRVSAAQFLVHGRLWRSPRWRAPPPTMELHDYGYIEHNASQFCLTPLVLAEVWRADNGSFALVAVNHDSVRALPINVLVDVAASGAPARLVAVNQTIQPRSVLVYELS